MAADSKLASSVAAAFRKWRVPLEPEQAGTLGIYLELLEHWNEAVSLTSIRDRPMAILRHFVEPAMSLPLLGGAGPILLDAGSGAGIPGLPLKVLDPDRVCRLVESNGRKATFLREVVETLGLEGVEVIEGRLEELVGCGRLSTPVHLLTARAWSGWGGLLGLGARLMVPGGRAVIFVGEETLRALRRHLGAGAEQVPVAATEDDWAPATRAGWRIRRVLPLPHLDRGWVVALELPKE
ncbi:MAG: 16S rRNA (guanine(527)-N(7))-methyltransferase RsmG [Acidobacteriota bacterium]